MTAPRKTRRRVCVPPEHPLAGKGVSVANARLVLWEKLAGADAPCHWCGTALRWTVDLCADHLDGDSLNDAPGNLVPACRGCNANRQDGTNCGRITERF